MMTATRPTSPVTDAPMPTTRTLPPRTLRVGARGSSLSLAQTGALLEQLRLANPGLETELIVIQTRGDKDQTTPLGMLWAPGAFVREIEKALLDGTIDLAVHSLKDMPVDPVPGLTIAAIPERAPASDILLTRAACRGLDDLPRGSVVATSSPRRAHQIKARAPWVETVPVRGNVPTRLRKLEEGEFDGIVLAAAGLQRLGISHPHSIRLEAPDFLPAPGQGALAAQTREGDWSLPIVQRIDDAATRAAVTAERAFLGACGGGCHAPLGALATLQNSLIRLQGQYFDGGRVLSGELSGRPADALSIGAEFARTILASR